MVTTSIIVNTVAYTNIPHSSSFVPLSTLYVTTIPVPLAITHLNGHDGESDPKAAERVGDHDEADDHHEGRGDEDGLDGLGHDLQVLVDVDEVGVEDIHLGWKLYGRTGEDNGKFGTRKRELPTRKNALRT